MPVGWVWVSTKHSRSTVRSLELVSVDKFPKYSGKSAISYPESSGFLSGATAATNRWPKNLRTLGTRLVKAVKARKRKKNGGKKGGLVQTHPQVFNNSRCPRALSKMAFFKDLPLNYDSRWQRRAELAER